jgi:hypothetical protein
VALEAVHQLAVDAVQPPPHDRGDAPGRAAGVMTRTPHPPPRSTTAAGRRRRRWGGPAFRPAAAPSRRRASERHSRHHQPVVSAAVLSDHVTDDAYDAPSPVAPPHYLCHPTREVDSRQPFHHRPLPPAFDAGVPRPGGPSSSPVPSTPRSPCTGECRTRAGRGNSRPPSRPRLRLTWRLEEPGLRKCKVLRLIFSTGGGSYPPA